MHVWCSASFNLLLGALRLLKQLPACRQQLHSPCLPRGLADWYVVFLRLLF